MKVESSWATKKGRLIYPAIKILAESVFPKHNDTSLDPITEPVVDNFALLSSELPYR